MVHCIEFWLSDTKSPDRKSLFRQLEHSPREVVLESGFMGNDAVEGGVFVKVGDRPLRGIPPDGPTRRPDGQNRLI